MFKSMPFYLAMILSLSSSSAVLYYASAKEAQSPSQVQAVQNKTEKAGLQLSVQALKNAEIQIQQVQAATLRERLRFPGQIAVDQHLQKSVAAGFGGVVSQMPRHVGQQVKKGDLLAVINSRELSELRLNFLKEAETTQHAEALFQQAQRLETQLQTLIQMLKKGGDFQALHTQSLKLELGASKAEILKRWSELQIAETIYTREKDLFARHLSPEETLLKAQQNFETAQSAYVSVLEELAREQANLTQSRKLDFNLAHQAKTLAQQQLHTLGETATPQTKLGLTRHEIRAPISGTIISKPVSEGQKLLAETTLYTIADLSHVWAEAHIYENHLDQVQLGLPVEIKATQQNHRAQGKLMHLNPLVDPQTRTAEAHAEIPNLQGKWFPGMYITLEVLHHPRLVATAVHPSALQKIRDRQVVFVQGEEGFVPREVVTGLESEQWIEIRSGLKAGESYASHNSFVLKSAWLSREEE